MIDKSLYQDIYDRIEAMRLDGVEPDRVVIPSNRWDTFKEKAWVKKEASDIGADEVIVNEVRAFHDHRQKNARIIIEVPVDD